MSVASIYTVKPGDTLSKIAQKYKITLAQVLAANQQITNPNLIQVGQVIKIPATAPDPAPTPAPGHSDVYDGIHPAAGTVTPHSGNLNYPPLTNSAANRNPTILDQVINQFAVGHNPRYLPDDGNTYCNIFAWDVTRAMDCEIPHWIDDKWNIARPNSSGAYEIRINEGIEWMIKYGVKNFGWQMATAQTAQDYANLGKVAVAMWKNPIPGGHGHIAVIRPGAITNKGAACAQAGGTNFNYGHIKDGFGALKIPKYYVHD